MVKIKEFQASTQQDDSAPFNEVTERDDRARFVTLPEDFARALESNKVALAAWDRLSYTHRKEYARSIEDAKKPDTRARRIQKAIAMLAATGKAKK